MLSVCDLAGFRSQLRQKYQLPETPCNDFCTMCFCGHCALAQDHRELKNRGWDPAIGECTAGNVCWSMHSDMSSNASWSSSTRCALDQNNRKLGNWGWKPDFCESALHCALHRCIALLLLLLMVGVECRFHRDGVPECITV